MALNCEMWEGLEAEGTFKGAKTLFVRSGTQEDVFRCASDYSHIFFTKEFKDWDTVVAILCKTSCLITVESWAEDVESIPWGIITRVHLLIRVDAPWVHRLKGTDNIILGSDYNGYAYVRDMGIRSVPDDYRSDVEVE